MAFVGVNGAGKSTMARTIAGQEAFDGGERRVGHNVSIAYFAQHQAEELNPDDDALQTVERVASGDTRRQLRTLLGCFLFHGDDVFKKVRVLSGGEKSRLAMAKMLLTPSNLLIMDEPTNHLDMRSKGVLQDALQDYEGSFIIVSHDRDFLDPLVNKVVEFSTAGIRVFTGTLSEYLEKKRIEREQQANQAKVTRTTTGAGIAAKERKRLEAEFRQERYRLTKPLQDKIAKSEKAIERLEKEKDKIEQTMAGAEFYRDPEHVKSVNTQYKNVQTELQEEYFRWGELSKKFDAMSAEINEKMEKAFRESTQ
jgi:ATP-binding cassette subfamily F protein 3